MVERDKDYRECKGNESEREWVVKISRSREYDKEMKHWRERERERERDKER